MLGLLSNFTQDVTHRIVPNWAAAILLVKDKDVTKTMHNPKNGDCRTVEWRLWLS